jgi:RNA polymerase sigma-70 factor (ECF subfamily)
VTAPPLLRYSRLAPPNEGGRLPEAHLVRLAQADPAAFEVLYERYVDRIYTYIRHRVGDRDEAEDLTARVFHQALSALPGYVDQGTPFSAWLFRIAHNLVANWLRDRARHPEVDIDLVGGAVAELEFDDLMASQAIAAARVRAAIASLGDDRQALLVLKFADELSNAEIAAILGRTESAVKSLYHRTLVDLRERLAPPTTAAPAEWRDEKEARLARG